MELSVMMRTVVDEDDFLNHKMLHFFHYIIICMTFVLCVMETRIGNLGIGQEI